jgi:arylsulfatase A-like enzyme
VSDRPNILVMMIDCLRWDRGVGEAGGAVIPTLTELREAGTSFDTAICTVSCTTPSTAAMLTGKYPANNGVLSMRGYRLKKEVVPLAQVLTEGGYHCRAEVTGPLVDEVGLGRGFASYVYRPRSRNIYSPFGDDLLETIRRLPEPWFLFVHVWVLHRPRKILRQFRRPAFGEYPYDRALSSIDTWLARVTAATPMDKTIVVTTGDHGERMQPGDFHPQAYRYVSRLSFMEEHWDRFRLWRKKHRPRFLRRLLHIEGEGAYHGFHIYDYLVRVPFFFTGGPFPAGLRVRDQVRHVDMMPTLLDAVGLDSPEGLDGRSILPLARGETLPPVTAYMEATGLNLGAKKNWIAGVRTPKWKYARRITDDEDSGREELYDLEADPNEESDLSTADEKSLTLMREEFDRITSGDSGGDLEEMSAEEMAKLDERLRALGYMD